MPVKALVEILREFRFGFTSSPTFDNFATLVVGWILCTGRHTISRVIQFGRESGGKHHSALYRFFSRAKWDTDALGLVLLRLVLTLVQEAVPLTVLVDDTLCRKSGAHLWGGGMHRDPLGSSYGGAGGRTIKFAFGHNWVTLCVWVPLPWNPRRGLAIPVLWRFYRPKKRCPNKDYRKRTELALELVNVLLDWVPSRPIVLVADAEYSCRGIVRGLPSRVTFVGPMDMDAALFALPTQPRGKGRPRKKGARLPSPAKLAADDSIPWEKQTVCIYGREVEILVKTVTCLWYQVAYTRPVRLVITRDPSGRIDDRAYFTTDPELTVETTLTYFSRRWSQEVMHRDVKQHLGLEDPQNGWWRNPAGDRPEKIAGPQPHATRGEKAVRRTAPIGFLVYALVVISYLRTGTPEADVRRARKLAPWYLHKTEPSFADMLAFARRELWASRFKRHRLLGPVSHKVTEVLAGYLLVA
jgi:DDE superfamily endonuclease